MYPGNSVSDYLGYNYSPWFYFSNTTFGRIPKTLEPEQPLYLTFEVFSPSGRHLGTQSLSDECFELHSKMILRNSLEKTTNYEKKYLYKK